MKKKLTAIFLILILGGCATASKRDLENLDDYGGASFTGEYSMMKFDVLYETIELITLYPEKSTTKDFTEAEIGLREYLNYVKAYKRSEQNYELSNFDGFYNGGHPSRN